MEPRRRRDLSDLTPQIELDLALRAAAIGAETRDAGIALLAYREVDQLVAARLAGSTVARTSIAVDRIAVVA
jgi:hypothetical protein